MAYPNGFGDADLGTFFGEFSVPVTHGTTTTVGVLDESTEDHQFPSQRSEVTTGESSMLVQRHAFTVLPKRNDPITVDGGNYYVNRTSIEADGRTMRIWMRKA